MTEYDADPMLDADPVDPVDLEPIVPLPAAAGPDTATAPARRAKRPAFAFAAALAVVSLVVGFAAATVVLNTRDTASSDVATGATGAPADPDEPVLGGLILRQTDVAAPNTVRLLPDHGADTTQPTLDLCNGTFPSEKLRTARRQVALVDAVPSFRMSTEAVLYERSANGVQAFAELKSVAAKCPSTPVVNPDDGSEATTKFRAAPDAAWARTPGVERLAYDFDTVGTGTSSHSYAVYLRRGRVLMGVYFAQPDGAQTAVDGHTTLPEIVAVFEARMAKLPERVVSGTP